MHKVTFHYIFLNYIHLYFCIALHNLKTVLKLKRLETCIF